MFGSVWPVFGSMGVFGSLFGSVFVFMFVFGVCVRCSVQCSVRCSVRCSVQFVPFGVCSLNAVLCSEAHFPEHLFVFGERCSAAAIYSLQPGLDPGCSSFPASSSASIPPARPPAWPWLQCLIDRPSKTQTMFQFIGTAGCQDGRTDGTEMHSTKLQKGKERTGQERKTN